MIASSSLALTNPQKRVWYTEKFYPSSAISNLGVLVTFKDEINFELLDEAIQTLIKTDETLRLVISELNETDCMQYINEYKFIKIPRYDYSNTDDVTLKKWLKNEMEKPFELLNSRLYDFTFLKLQDKSGFYAKFHHIILDGVAVVNAINRILDIYVSLLNGSSIKLNYPSYISYINNEKEYLVSNRFYKDQAFWLKEFETLPEFIGIKNVDLYNINTVADRISYVIPSNVQENIGKFCEDNNISIFALFTTLLDIYLYRIFSQKDIVLGTSYSNRTNALEKESLGMFVSTTPLRTSINPDDDVISFIKKLSKLQMNAIRYQKYPYNLLINELREAHRDIARLFAISIEYQVLNWQIRNGLEYTVEPLFSGHEMNELTLHVKDKYDTGELQIDIDYRNNLFTSDEIDTMINRLVCLLEDTIENPTKKIFELEICPSEEQILIRDFNMATRYSDATTIQNIFESQSQFNPEQIAVICDDKQLTYKELNERANQLALNLRLRGVLKDQLIGIMTERSIETVISIFAILKAGSAFIPIDPDYPKERILYMLNDSKASYVLTQSHIIKQLDIDSDPDFSFVEWIDILDENNYESDSSNLISINDVNDLAYVIYTSGTTGNPKGVMIEHKGISNLVDYFKKDLLIKKKDVVGQFASISFDASVWEITMGLLTGATLCIVPSYVRNDYIRFQKYVNAKQVSVLTLPPTFLNYLNPNEISSVRIIITAGSASSLELINKWSNKVTYYNAYGPTEGSICATVWKTDGEEARSGTITIGKPIRNTKVHILSEYGQLQPIGVPGELCIAGVGIARGYLGKEELTKEKFILNPWNKEEIIYRTGDLACWLPDGNIKFLGRLDDQVKVRGHRIELGEVESIICSIPKIMENTVISKADENGDHFLCVYYVSDEEIDSSEIISFLEKKLPRFMIPSYFLQINQLPLSPSGKVDRNKLPELNERWKKKGIKPSSNEEYRMLEIWKQVLEEDNISTDDSFFTLGGHSLKAMLLASQIKRVFGKEIGIGLIFEKSTIKDLTQHIVSLGASDSYDIVPSPLQNFHKASSAQRRLYFINKMDPTSTSYNMSGAMIIEGRLDTSKLNYAYQEIVNRHESLRTSFDMVNGELVQIINPKLKIEMDILDSKDEDIEGINKIFVRPFDLKEPTLVRACLVKLNENRNFFLLDMHHIISDGVSISIIFNELAQIYQGEKLEQPKLQYKDYVSWQNGLLNSERMSLQEKYWVDTFTGEVPVLEFPTDYVRPTIQQHEGSSCIISLNKELTESLKQLALRTESTLYMVMLAAYNILLYKYTKQTDIVVGSPVSGRSNSDFNGTVGMFVNTLAIRSSLQGKKNFLEFLFEVKKQVTEAINHQDYPFEMLLEKLQLDRDLSRNPLYDTMFALQNFNASTIRFDDLYCQSLDLKHNTSKVDISLIAVEDEEIIKCYFEYCTALFNQESIELLSKYFKMLLKEVSNNPNKAIDDINLLSESDINFIINNLNTTQTTNYSEQNIIDLFNEQVRKNPENIAIDFENKQFTYRQLNDESNQLARYLRFHNVKTGDLVALMIDRSIEMIIGILAILKAGGAYVPIDPEYPIERINYILDDTKVNTLLYQENIAKSQINNAISIEKKLIIDSSFHKHFETSNLEKFNNSNDLAYVMYTSGTTGKPKGILTSHSNIIHVVKETNYIQLSEKDILLGLSNFAFDGSTFDIFGALLNGAKLVIVPKKVMLDAPQLKSLIVQKKVTVFFVTTALFNVLIDENVDCLKNVRKVLFGGERASVTHVKNALEYLGTDKIIHVYGPTENTVFSTYHPVNSISTNSLSIPIGKPISNTRVYILDNNNRPLPIGIAGEICVTGFGLSKGYLNMPDLNKVKFVNDPFSNGEKMYRTGDLARWLPDGTIEFINRLDHQVKLRGHRIELGEIENALIQVPHIKEAVSLILEDLQGNKYICAYLASSKNINKSEMREYLAKSLPNYMIPTSFVQLEKLPLTPSGKIDRKALPEPDQTASSNEYVKPSSNLEQRMCVIWQQVLGVEFVGITDNFFELGGDSIKAIQVSARLQQHNMEMEIKHLFQNPTIKELVGHIKRTDKEVDQGIIEGEVELTPIQKWFFDQNYTDMHHFNQSVMLFKENGFDKNVTPEVIKKIVEHHDGLRMGYTHEQGQWKQFNKGIGNQGELFSFEVVELKGKGNIEEQLKKHTTLLQGKMDLKNGPLVRVGLYKTNDGDYLLISIHHLVVDGVSWRILCEDFSTAYEQVQRGEEIKLPPKTDSYREWASQLQKYANNKEFLSELEYWRMVEEAKLPPIRRDHVALQNYMKNSGSVILQLSKEHTEQLLSQVNYAYNTEINDILLTALSISLKNWMNTDKILINLEGHGREEIIKNLNITRTVGWFTSQFPVVFDLSDKQIKSNSDSVLSYCIKSVKETLRRIPNRGIGYGILKYLTTENKKNRLLFQQKADVNFNYLGQFNENIFNENNINVFSFGQASDYSKNVERKYILDVTGMVKNGSLNMYFTYNTQEYFHSTILDLANQMKNNIEIIIQHCSSRKKTELTPSDAGNEDLSLDELQDITSFFEKISVNE